MTPTPAIPVNNFYLTISTASAQTLSNQLQKALAPSWHDPLVIIPIITGVFSLVATCISLFAVFNANKIAKSVRGSDVLELFFDISSKLPMEKDASPTPKHLEYVCNYFDYVCMCIEAGYLNKVQQKIMEDVMQEDQFYKFVPAYRKAYGDYFVNYIKWYEKQQKKKEKGNKKK